MNLIIDIGNSLVKLAVFQQDVLLEKNRIEKKEMQNILENLLHKYPIGRVVISNVSKWLFDFSEVLPSGVTVLELNQHTPLPFLNKYATPETLGNDRKALVAAAVKHYPQENVLVIDAGTCITYDFKNAREEYLGGAISPGLRMRFMALNTFTSNLPLVEVSSEFSLTGDSTLASINSGVQNGMILEVQGVINRYSEKYEDLRIIITGGDASFLSINLKNGIFANSNFLLEGLNFILEYNINK